MAINLLDEHTAELIAAGEVVERPAAVVKELVENAIDAGASAITVEIERGGIALMRITDNGAGIETEDIELAFMRHATSKVRTQEDLENICTLGFRGEALCSIASVAKVQLLTKHSSSNFAAHYSVNGGVSGTIAEDARPQGTTIIVEDLFYNTPARMKFLKKDASEGGYVTETVSRLALSHPSVAFNYVREGRQVFSTPGSGNLQAAIYSVLGAAFAKELVPINYTDANHTVTGFITPPRGGRASRSMQYFYVNGRFVKNGTIMAALEQAYKGTMLQGKYPGAVVFLQMPPTLVDVNVHPAKTEVRFAREQDIFGFVYRAVKSALITQKENYNELIFKNKEQETEQKQITKEEKPNIVYAVTEKPLQSKQPMELNSPAVQYQVSAPVLPLKYKENPWNMPNIDGPEDENSPQVQQSFQPEPEKALLIVGEVFKTYIAAQWGQVLCFIDKHAAHERILYEQLAAQRSAPDFQQLLSPLNVTLSAPEKTALLENTKALEETGVELEDFGGNAVLVRAVPANAQINDVENLIIELAQRLLVNSADKQNSKTELLMHSIACRSAIKAGQKIAAQEMLALAQSILQGDVPPFCPHGRPVVLQISRKQLEKQFGRLG